MLFVVLQRRFAQEKCQLDQNRDTAGVVLRGAIEPIEWLDQFVRRRAALFAIIDMQS